MEKINITHSSRDKWKSVRHLMECESLAQATPGRIKSVKKWFVFSYTIKFLKILLDKTRLFKRGESNAKEVEVNLIDHQFENLPVEFNGKCILHLSDLHLQERPDVVKSINSLAKGHHVDILVFTGDFSTKNIQNYTDEEIANFVGEIIRAVNPAIGSFGVLGNHDHSGIVDHLESIGLRLLINEAIDIKGQFSEIRIIGTDDPHYYYTDDAKKALSCAHEKFSIALIHTPELFDIAMYSGVDLYLTGHSHGGQICLPAGLPILTHLNSGKRFFRGKWKLKNMLGYTSKGVGTVALPVRFNARAEITFHYLRCAN